MAKIVDNSKFHNHNIDRYDFKPLQLDEIPKERPEPIKQTPAFIKDDAQVDTSELTQSSKDSLIESLLKKTDDMSSNFIKLQMKLESMSDEHKNELERVKKESFELGVKEGLAQSEKNEQSIFSKASDEFTNSILKLEQSASSFTNSLESIKNELVLAALELAKEVIKIETSSNSNNIAIALANELIDELKDVSNITLKVNPQDFAKLSSTLSSLTNVKVTADSAIAMGGVVALSSSSNIDARIKKRFEKAKRVALGE
ncbi:MAG: flagellar assembly protein FliH [Sulfurimonadaceae bacterium]|jgi:flagellar assembly protein FliH|nr:flagellar assembly protein FliH [Sulfurimonadaceae bacterium]